jgi:hypothetical protein
MDIDVPKTPIELSRANSGFRFYSCDVDLYAQLSKAVDESRNYPQGPTLRGLPESQFLQMATDGSGNLLIAIDCWRFTPEDDAMIEAAGDGVKELTQTEFNLIRPAAVELE